MSNTTAGHSDDQTAQISTRLSLTKSELAGFIDDLIEGRKDVVCELNLNDGFHALRCHANRRSDNPLLRQRCVKNSIGPKFGLEVACTPEDTTKYLIGLEEDPSVRVSGVRRPKGFGRTYHIFTKYQCFGRSTQGSP